MTTFLSGMSNFAKQDVYSGEEYYPKFLKFKITEAMNAQFEFFGSDSMIMMTNSGSFFIIQGQLIVVFMIAKMSNTLAKRNSEYKRLRALGI